MHSTLVVGWVIKLFQRRRRPEWYAGRSLIPHLMDRPWVDRVQAVPQVELIDGRSDALRFIGLVWFEEAGPWCRAQVRKKAFPKSGQGEARLVSRIGDTSEALYVLKTMPPAQASRPERQERFKPEIEALRQFDERMSRDDAKANLDARAILFNCCNQIFREHNCPISKAEIEGAAIIERESSR